MPTRWPFPDDPSLAVITLKRIVFGDAPVLSVKHDTDGMWQFLDCEPCVEEDAAMVGLAEMVERYPELTEAAMLPMGFAAIRETVEEPWQLYLNDGDGDGE